MIPKDQVFFFSILFHIALKPSAPNWREGINLFVSYFSLLYVALQPHSNLYHYQAIPMHFSNDGASLYLW